MVEIGSGLREARLRLGLELAQIEAETKIRARYLAALENERFELLPGRAYARGFLRTYAEFLGLDPEPYLDALRTRLAEGEEVPLPPSLVRVPRRGLVPRALGLALAALTAAALLALLAWQLGGSGSRPVELSPPAPASEPGRSAPAAARETGAGQPAEPKRRASAARLVLTATRGPCWLEVHAGGSRSGKLLFRGLLAEGRSIRFASSRLWLRLGWPPNLDARLNGEAVRLPARTGNVVVSAKGIRTVEA